MMVRLLIGISFGIGIGALMGYFGKCSSGTCPLTANPYRGALFGAAIGAVLAMTSAGSRENKDGSADASTTHEALVEIKSTEDFNHIILGASVPTLVDFYSNGCPPCRRLAPTIATLAGKYEGRAVISKVNVDTTPELAKIHGIRGIPAVLFFDAGKEVDRLVGLQKQPVYEKVLDAMLAKYPTPEATVTDTAADTDNDTPRQ